jgi:hypothetical protein
MVRIRTHDMPQVGGSPIGAIGFGLTRFLREGVSNRRMRRPHGGLILIPEGIGNGRDFALIGRPRVSRT